MTSRKPSAANKYVVPAVEQMLDIVEHLAQNHRPYGITELARSLGISTNGVFRILKCLAKRGYAEVDPAGGYQLGIFCIGAPVFDVHGEAVAGVGVTGLVSVSHPKKQSVLEHAILACAEDISRDIGYEGALFAGFRSQRKENK